MLKKEVKLYKMALRYCTIILFPRKNPIGSSGYSETNAQQINLSLLQGRSVIGGEKNLRWCNVHQRNLVIGKTAYSA